MDEEVTTETTESEGKGLRGQLEKSIGTVKDRDDTIATLKTQLLAQAYVDLSLDPTKELGKAIAKEYDGEPTLEGLAAYAKEEYGYVPPAVATEVNPQVAVIGQEQAALDQAGEVAGSVPVAPTEGDALAKAEADGDYKTTLAIKSQQLADSLKP